MMKLSLICMALMFCLFADTKQTNVADTISATTGNFVSTDYSRGEARVVKTSLPPSPPPAPSSPGSELSGLAGFFLVLLVTVVVISVVAGLVFLVAALAPAGGRKLARVEITGPEENLTA